jgi:cytochrome c5
MKRRIWMLVWMWCAAAACPAAESLAHPTVAPVNERGARLYREQCMSCHGAKGEGVADKHDEPLYGERSVESLARLIAKTMPEDKPGTCVGEDADSVAAYIFEAFYSPQARARNNPPRVELARLTNRQYRESVADLVGSFRKVQQTTVKGGLRAEYFQSNGMNKKDKKILSRIDESVDFNFGGDAPVDGVAHDQFSIAWAGSLLAPDTGFYEFRLTTPNGARLYLNADLLAGDSNRRDDSDARRQPATVDLWVSAGSEPRVGAARLFLLGGRSYPMRVDFFKFKDAVASVRVEWKPPHGVWSVLGAEHLSPEPSSSVFVVGTPFPPDDGSAGYERGTAVSKAWHEATTRAAVETANGVAARLEGLTGASEGATNWTESVKSFAARFTERAFRQPLTPELKAGYVDAQFEAESSAEKAVKRVVMLVLKSPRFLYPELGEDAGDYRVAARLALNLWDSIPDTGLLEAAARGELRSPEAVRGQAERMMGDARTRAKLKDFFHHWLHMEEADDVSKDAKAFPGFDEALVADLRASMETFVDRVVWGEASDYRELLLADYLFVNRRLADFYGLKFEAAGAADPWVRVALDPKERAGIFTHPFLLSVLSYHRSTSPIHRGVFLTRNVLGRFLKPPPMAIVFMDDRFDPSLTMREKVTELTKSDTCMGCHATINPLGFSLEHFDAVGKFRTEDNSKPVNAAAEYTTVDGDVVSLRSARDLAGHAAKSADARRGFVRQLFQHTIKQPPAAYGADTLERLDAGFAEGGHHIRRLLVDLAVLTAGQGFGTQLSSTP